MRIYATRRRVNIGTPEEAIEWLFGTGTTNLMEPRANIPPQTLLWGESGICVRYAAVEEPDHAIGEPDPDVVGEPDPDVVGEPDPDLEADFSPTYLESLRWELLHSQGQRDVNSPFQYCEWAGCVLETTASCCLFAPYFYYKTKQSVKETGTFASDLLCIDLADEQIDQFFHKFLGSAIKVMNSRRERFGYGDYEENLGKTFWECIEGTIGIDRVIAIKAKVEVPPALRNLAHFAAPRRRVGNRRAFVIEGM